MAMKGRRTTKSGAAQAGAHCSIQAPSQYGSNAVGPAAASARPGCSHWLQGWCASSSMVPKLAMSAAFQGSRPT